MIPAAEALLLPSAKLSAEEQTAADELERAIEAHVLEKMERGGCIYQTREQSAPVLAEMALRLRRAGWHAQVGPWIVQTPFSREPTRVGSTFALVPSDDAYRAAEAIAAA